MIRCEKKKNQIRNRALTHHGDANLTDATYRQEEKGEREKVSKYQGTVAASLSTLGLGQGSRISCYTNEQTHSYDYFLTV